MKAHLIGLFDEKSSYDSILACQFDRGATCKHLQRGCESRRIVTKIQNRQNCTIFIFSVLFFLTNNKYSFEIQRNRQAEGFAKHQETGSQFFWQSG